MCGQTVKLKLINQSTYLDVYASTSDITGKNWPLDVGLVLKIEVYAWTDLCDVEPR